MTGTSFAVLFALAGPEPMTERELRRRLRLPGPECRRVVDALHQRYLLDVVSRLEGNDVKETLSLTDEGERALVKSLESMCELPELP